MTKRMILLATVLIGVLVLAGCSSSGAKTVSQGASTTTAAGTSKNASTAAFTACLKKNGVDIGSFGRRTGTAGDNGGTPPTGGEAPIGGTPPAGAGGGGAGGGRFANNPKFQKAFAACASLRPAGGSGFGGGGARGTAFTKYQTCMSQHGITLPDRTFGGATTGSTTTTAAGVTTTTIDRTSPLYVAAAKACASLLPTRGAGAGTTN
jgi:hypothetical protein